MVVKFALDVLYFIYAYFVRSGKNLKKTYGDWAIVTGDTHLFAYLFICLISYFFTLRCIGWYW